MQDNPSDDEDGPEFYLRRRLEVSHWHYFTAVYTMNEAARLEGFTDKEHVSGDDSEYNLAPRIRHRSCVLSSITASYGYLEAYINEFYDSLVSDISKEELESPVDERTGRLVQRIESVEDEEFSRKPTIKKYQLALTYLDQEPFERGTEPIQEIVTIRRLRNYLSHYDPEWFPLERSEKEGPHSVGSALQGKFPENRFAGEDQPFFPFRCLGAGCADWAIKSVTEFIDEFADRTHGTPPHQRYASSGEESTE